MRKEKGRPSAKDIERFESELSGAMWACPNCGGVMKNGEEGPSPAGENGKPTNAALHEVVCGGEDGGGGGCGLVAHMTLVPTLVFVPEDYLPEEFKVMRRRKK